MLEIFTLFNRTLHLIIILLLYVLFEHPVHTCRGFGSAFSDRGMTSGIRVVLTVGCLPS
jgi:hypothetical protein